MVSPQRHDGEQNLARVRIRPAGSPSAAAPGAGHAGTAQAQAGPLLDLLDQLDAGLEGEGGARNVDVYFAQIDQLAQNAQDERTEELLSQLYDYAEAIAPSA